MKLSGFFVLRFWFLSIIAIPGGCALLLHDAAATDLAALGLVNVLEYGADPSGTRDSTEAIREAITAAYGAGKATFFPSGTYLVSDTLNMSTSSDDGYVLIGSTHGRATIRLHNGAAGFGACAGYPNEISDCVLKATVSKTTCDVSDRPSVKPVFDFWRHSATCPGERELADGSRTYAHVIKHLDIVLGDNPGAVALRENGAENVLIEDLVIHAAGGFSGLYEMSASGALLTDIEIIGGQHAIYAPVSRGGAALITGLRLRDQQQSPIVFDAIYPLTLVGFDISVSGKPVIETKNLTRSGEHLTLVDGVLRSTNDSGLPFVDNSDRSIYLKNVYATGALTLVGNGDGSSLTVPSASSIYRVEEYGYAGDFASLYGDSGKLIAGVKTDDTYFNGIVTPAGNLMVVEEAALIPSDLQTRHTLARDFCDIENEEMVNAKDFGAIGNGSADDTVALKAAIAGAAGAPGVLLPPGNYLVSATLDLGSHTRLCGVSKGQVRITTPRTWKPSAPTPVIRTADDPDGTAAVSDFSVEIFDPSVYALHWRVGRGSVVHRVSADVDSTFEGQTYARDRILISGGGGGRWYGLIQNKGYWLPQHPDLRTLKISGTAEPLTFYVLHTQYVKPAGNPMVEVRDSANVTIFGGKHEFQADTSNQRRFPAGTLPFVLGIYNSREIGLYGMEGRSWTDVGDAVVEVVSSANVTIANMGLRPTTVFYYPDSQWYHLKEVTPDGSQGILASSFVALFKSAFNSAASIW